MKFTWFATFRNHNDLTRCITQAEKDRILDIISSTPGLTRGLIYTPWPVEGLQYNDGPSPHLQLQLYFDEIDALELAISKAGNLQVIARAQTLPSLAGAAVTEQAMLVRNYPVASAPAKQQSFCTYLVHYPGPAEDPNLWLRHYIDGHTPVMRRFPRIRGLEVCSRIDWCSALPWERVNYMQRNKVVFDDARALKAALSSAVMQEMRADLAKFPPYSGGNAHYPMHTISVHGDASEK